jgi:type VI secretion system secreted protein VgrG
MAASSQNAQLTQEGRLLQVDTTLPSDTFIIRQLVGHEGISELFKIHLDFASDNHNVDPASLIGKPATVRILFGDDWRYINGIFNEFVLLPTDDRYARYRATLVPWLWLLTRTTDCCIHQKQSVPDIIKDVFTKHGLVNFKDDLRGNHPVREYCVQYRETAFDFVSRLMEEEGICYYFEHEEKTHTLVLADTASSHKPCPLESTVLWEPASGRGFAPDENYVIDWIRRLEVRPHQWTQGDFEFTKPRLHLTATEPTRSTLDVPKFERYDYPGRFSDMDGANELTKLRMEEEEAEIDLIAGRSTCRTFQPGFRFKIQNHYRRDQNGEYLLVSLDHQAQQGALHSGDTSPEAKYENTFTAIPKATPYRPPRATPRPTISGPQTAFVTGPPGEEIYVDQYGRVKVQFHWDRMGKYDANSSCWVRVSQMLAGKKWGSVQLPRIGQEVIVDFLNGDPDQPIITGRVYNADSMQPYALPDEQSKSTYKTLSYPGGGGFNELRFEDRKGEEQIFIHAERNYDLRIKKDQFTTVLGESHFLTKAEHFTTVKADQHLEVTGDQNQKIGGTVSLQAGADWQQKVATNFALQSGMEIHMKSGVNLVLETGASLTLKVGGNFININPAGVFIKGAMVMLNSGGAAGSGAGASPMSPNAPKEADTATPGEVVSPPPPLPPPKPVSYSQAALVMKEASRDGKPFCEI